MQRQGLGSTYLSICSKLNKVLKPRHTDKPLLLYRCGYSQLIFNQMVWYDVKKKKPHAYQSGGWDGLKSDKILVCTRSGKYHVAEMYAGVMDGSEFNDFYDDRDFEIENVAFWTEIDRAF